LVVEAWQWRVVKQDITLATLEVSLLRGLRILNLNKTALVFRAVLLIGKFRLSVKVLLVLDVFLYINSSFGHFCGSNL
jgi:hypothetical protein